MVGHSPSKAVMYRCNFVVLLRVMGLNRGSSTGLPIVKSPEFLSVADECLLGVF